VGPLPQLYQRHSQLVLGNLARSTVSQFAWLLSQTHQKINVQKTLPLSRPRRLPPMLPPLG